MIFRIETKYNATNTNNAWNNKYNYKYENPHFLSERKDICVIQRGFNNTRAFLSFFFLFYFTRLEVNECRSHKAEENGRLIEFPRGNIVRGKKGGEEEVEEEEEEETKLSLGDFSSFPSYRGYLVVKEQRTLHRS